MLIELKKNLIVKKLQKFIVCMVRRKCQCKIQGMVQRLIQPLTGIIITLHVHVRVGGYVIGAGVH